MADISIPAALLGIMLLSDKKSEKMSKADIQREAAYLTLHALDWGQTLDIRTDRRNRTREDGSGVEHYEGNPLLGKRPSRGKVNRYFASTALLHLGITKKLKGSKRKLFQLMTIGVEADVVNKNFMVNARVDF